MRTSKTVADSAVTHYPVAIFPVDLNAHGTIFGGRILSEMDWLAAYVTQRHVGNLCVTLGVDSVRFLAPARQGEVLIFKTTINRVWRTSLEVGIKVLAENQATGESRHVVSAYFTFVSVDENGKPKEILVDLIPETEDEKRRYAAAEMRRQQRLSN